MSLGEGLASLPFCFTRCLPCGFPVPAEFLICTAATTFSYAQLLRLSHMHSSSFLTQRDVAATIVVNRFVLRDLFNRAVFMLIFCCTVGAAIHLDDGLGNHGESILTAWDSDSESVSVRA